jgi:hypothetical protein
MFKSAVELSVGRDLPHSVQGPQANGGTKL